MDSSDHGRRLFPNNNTTPLHNSTSPTLYTINNRIIPPVRPAQTIVRENSIHNIRTQIPRQITSISPPPTNKTPVKPSIITNPAVTQNGTPRSAVSDNFSNSPRTPSNPQNLRNHVTYSPIRIDHTESRIDTISIADEVYPNTLTEEITTREDRLTQNPGSGLESDRSPGNEITQNVVRQERKMELERARKFKDVFSGEEGQNIEAFFDKFEKWCMNQGHDDEYKLQNIIFCLDGSAYTSFKTMAPELKSSYPSLKKELITYYAPTKLPVDEQFQQVQELKMKKTETVQTFFNLLMKKTQHLDMSQEQKTVLFKAGLPRYIRKYVKLERPKSLTDTLIKAREAEELGSDYDEDGDMKEVKNSIQTLITKLDASNTPTVASLGNQEPTKCAWCLSTQHALAQCQLFQNKFKQNRAHNFNPQNNPKSLPHYQPGYIPHQQVGTIAICDYCNKSGHRTNECWQLKALRADNTRNHHNTAVICQLCDKRGHKASQCLSARNVPQNSTERPFCSYCGKRNHLMRTCFLLNNQIADKQNEHSATNADNQSYFDQDSQQDVRPFICSISVPTKHTQNTSAFNLNSGTTRKKNTNINPVPTTQIRGTNAPKLVNLDAVHKDDAIYTTRDQLISRSNIISRKSTENMNRKECTGCSKTLPPHPGPKQERPQQNRPLHLVI